ACIQRQYAPTVDQQVAQCLISQCEVDPDQHNVLAILEQNMHKLWRIQGAGGHGKSHTLRAFIAKATSMGKRVIVCATTAKASKLLGDGACTVHMAFGFTGPSWIPLTNPNILMYIDLADVIVIDEVSMAKADLLQEVHQRCIDASPNSTEPFAGKFVILGGDKHQLPAVCDRRCNEASCIHQPYRWAMWPHFREIVLQKNYFL
ncbi:hypothetical protein Vretimale_18793, partial [Volvox reticuliferus]